MDVPGQRSADAQATRQIFRVSDLAAGIKGLLEDSVGRVWVVGEIRDLFRARSGHCYFTLTDEDAQLRAVLFRGNLTRIPFDPEDGLEVVALAELSFYEPRGDVQLIVRGLEPRGQGALQLAFEQLRQRLAEEGLFDEADKRELPEWPRRIGIVTSPVGAALHDVIEVTGRRAPGIPLVVSPTRVQGDGAEAEIDAALARVGQLPDVDVVLLVRGGGSLEDLMAFNSERVARAIRASRPPVIAGVGHEVDLTIADLAADARAPTPSAAAELAVPDLGPWLERLQREQGRLDVAIDTQLERQRGRVDRLSDALHAASPQARLSAQRTRLEAARSGLARAVDHRRASARERWVVASGRMQRSGIDLLVARAPRAQALERRLRRVMPERLDQGRGRFAALVGRLHALSPLAVLSRGFAIVRRPDGRIVRRASETEVGAPIEIQLGEGQLAARVEVTRSSEDDAE